MNEAKKTIDKHMAQCHDHLLGIKPVIKTFIIPIEIKGDHSKWRIKAESLSQAESNLMKFLSVKSCTFPGSSEMLNKDNNNE